jgi:LPXTG-motif cell wall-anchored protein
VGIPESMNKVTRLRHARQRAVKVQRRLWLAHALMWPTLIAAGVLLIGGLVWFFRRRSAGGRHEMPDTPGAHEAGTTHVEP